MNDGFMVGNGLKQGNGLAPTFFNIALEYLIGYADDINIMGRTKSPVSEVYKELQERAKEVGLNSTVEETKELV